MRSHQFCGSLVRPLAVAALAVAGLAGCEGGASAPVAQQPAPVVVAPKAVEKMGVVVNDAARKQAKSFYKTTCATCHGEEGRGDGQSAAVLNPRPRNYHDAAWQQSVSDDLIAKAILEGGPSVGKSQLMPPNPTLKDTPAVVAALVEMIREFGKHPDAIAPPAPAATPDAAPPAAK